MNTKKFTAIIELKTRINLTKLKNEFKLWKVCRKMCHMKGIHSFGHMSNITEHALEWKDRREMMFDKNETYYMFAILMV